MASGQMRYMFIDCPTPDKAKIRNTRGSKSAARAHVTKEFHRKVRLKRRETFESDTSASPPPASQVSASDVAIKEEAEESHDALEQIPFRDRERSPSMSNAVARSVIRSNLSQSRTDPFGTFPIQDQSPFMQRVLDHALVHTWPATMPVKGKTLENPINAAWLQSSRDYPVVFHAFLYAASLHLLVASQGHELVKSAPWWRFDHYQKTIAQINQYIGQLDGPPPDALIMAVTILAVHGKRDRNPPPECHPMSPLATQQYLHIYGQMLPEERHIQGLRELIQRKGGIDEMSTYGMADTIALADLYFATKHVKAPELAMRFPKQSLLSTGKHIPDLAAVALGSKLGIWFLYLSSNPPGKAIYEVLAKICELTLALDQHTRRGSGAPDVVELVPARNAVQYQLLSLDLGDSAGQAEDKAIAEICRIAALIYSDMVVFPLPATQRIKSILAGMLKTLLGSFTDSHGQDSHRSVLTWATTLGCIASTFTPGQQWFLEQLREHASTLMIRDWPCLKSLCMRFLWWCPVCDPPGKVIWSELQALNEEKSDHKIYH